MTDKIFESYGLGDLPLANRIVMAPMTRGRAENPGLVPVEIMAEYYAQRSTAGLIVTEGTWVNSEGIGYINVPGIWSEPQVAGWRVVTDAVHAAGGKIFNQIAHLGAVSHPDHLHGELPMGPSAVNPNEQSYTPDGFKDTPVPREMTHGDIRNTIGDFRQAAQNAKKAGFDGVEIHGAYLYLVQEFLNSATNIRTDEYGGSPANRCRFVIELLEAVTSVWGPKRVGLKLSPATSSGTLKPNADTEPTFRHLVQKLNDFDLAYLHAWGPQGPVKGTYAEAFEDIGAYFRALYDGTIIVAGGYDLASAQKAIESGNADLVAFGVPFIANPDLVYRFKNDVALNAPDQEKFYAGGASGYIDFPSVIG